MSGRVFVAPNAGRVSRNSPQVDEPWGTTSNSQFRSFEPSEVKNCRSTPAHVKPCLQQSIMSGGRASTGRLHTWNRHASDYPDPAPSAVTDRSGGASGSGSQGSYANRGKEPPSWEQVHRRPIQNRPFNATSTSQDAQLHAQEERHGHFPYRDEFAPRSKRLLYEMAAARCSRDSVKSASTADGVSCFTLTSSAVTGTSRRSASTPSLIQRRVPTADSARIPGGIAKRRLQSQLRAPTQWEPDRQWFQEKWDAEGPSGLATGNFHPSMHDDRNRSYAECMNVVSSIVGGRRDNEPRPAA